MKGQFLLALYSCWLVASLYAQSEQDEILRNALQDEMDRSLSELQLDDEPKPYFISYSVIETNTASVSYVLGSHNSSSTKHNRVLFVIVRVGTPELDNSNFLDAPGGRFDFGTTLPLEDSYDELRRAIWKATDSTYKNALSNLSTKKSALENQFIGDRTADFSESTEPHTYISSTNRVTPDFQEIARVARETSLAFQDLPEIFSSTVRVNSSVSMRTYLDSDGNFNRIGKEHCTLSSRAKTQAIDGARLGDSTFSFAKKCSQLPSIDQLKKNAIGMAEGLIARRYAEPLYRYSGPVLFESGAAATFLNQVLVKLLGATRIHKTGDELFDSAFESLRNPFIDKLNSRVLPKSLTIVNDPLQTEHDGRTLLGSYRVDAEGIPARRTELVSKGILKTLLSTRSPVEGIPSSTGSHRGFTNPLPGNIFIEPQEGLSMVELKNELLTLAKDNGSEFALLIRKMRSLADIGAGGLFSDDWFNSQMGSGISAMPALDLVKVYTDGREVTLMPMVVVDFVDSYFKDIVATSEETFHHDRVLSPLGSTHILSLLNSETRGTYGSQQFISFITPALLFKDLDLRNAVGFKPKLPAVSHPLTDN